MSLFGKKTKQTQEQSAFDLSVSTLVIAAEDNANLDTFNNAISTIKLSSNEISTKTNQCPIPLSNAKKSIKLISDSKLKLNAYDIVIFFHCDELIEQLLPIVRQKNGKLFVIVYSNNANESAIFREKLFNLQCNMVTKDIASMSKVYELISMAKLNTSVTLQQNTQNPSHRTPLYNCPFPDCGIANLTEDDLWHHCPLYHIGQKNLVHIDCPICNKSCGGNRNPFQVHLRNNHGLCAIHKCEPEYKGGTPSYVFSLVVVRRPSDHKYLLVQEFASCGFWLPGGRVDPGETTESAALRECAEEAGVGIVLKGILKIEYIAYRFENRKYEHQPDRDYARMRVIYYAEPWLPTENENEDEAKQQQDVNKDDKQLLAKSVPDYESMGACWVHVDEIAEVKLRGFEPAKFIPYVENGGKIYPLELLECEQRDNFV